MQREKTKMRRSVQQLRLPQRLGDMRADDALMYRIGGPTERVINNVSHWWADETCDK